MLHKEKSLSITGGCYPCSVTRRTAKGTTSACLRYLPHIRFFMFREAQPFRMIGVGFLNIYQFENDERRRP